MTPLMNNGNVVIRRGYMQNGNILFHEVSKLYEVIEKDFRNRNSYGELDRILFFLYKRTQREYHICELIISSKIHENHHIEILPHLRAILESIFHIRYISKNITNVDKLLEEYSDYEKYQANSLYFHVDNLVKTTDNDKLKDRYANLLQNYKLEGYDKKKINYLKNICELSKEVDRYHFYVEFYKVLSAYTHVSTSTYQQYGTLENGVFYFDKIHHNEDEADNIEWYLHVLNLDFLEHFISIFFNQGVVISMFEYTREKFYTHVKEK